MQNIHKCIDQRFILITYTYIYSYIGNPLFNYSVRSRPYTLILNLRDLVKQVTMTTHSSSPLHIRKLLEKCKNGILKILTGMNFTKKKSLTSQLILFSFHTKKFILIYKNKKSHNYESNSFHGQLRTFSIQKIILSTKTNYRNNQKQTFSN